MAALPLLLPLALAGAPPAPHGPAGTQAASLGPLAPARPAAFEALPLSLGVRVRGGAVAALLPRGTPLPASATALFTTTADSQPHAWFELCLGERPVASGNRLLARLKLSPLPERSYRSFTQLEAVVRVEPTGDVLLTVADVENRAAGAGFAEAAWAGDLAAPAEACGPEESDGPIDVFSDALVKHLPVLLATRAVRVGDRDLVIRQHQRRADENVGTGGALWESAIVLADFVHRHRGFFSWEGKRVLELGAGTGLVAIALALEGAAVLATDGNPQVCRGAEANAELNLKGSAAAASRLRFEVFDWHSEEDLSRVAAAGPWDVVLGSDLVYPGNAGKEREAAPGREQPPADAALLRLLAVVAGARAEVLLALKDRTGEVERFLQGAEAALWSTWRAPGSAVLPGFARAVDLAPGVGGALAVLRLRRASAAAEAPGAFDAPAEAEAGAGACASGPPGAAGDPFVPLGEFKAVVPSVYEYLDS